VYIDCHTHILPQDRMTKLVRWAHRGLIARGVPPDITPDQAVADLRRNGAVRWANLLFPLFPNEAQGLHAWGAELAERYPEMTPFGGVLADDPDPLGVVQEAIERHGMAGIKFHPMVQRFVPWDERLRPVLHYLEGGSRPVYVHTGYEDWYGWSFDREGLERMLDDYPDLPVVLPHVGYPDLEWGFGLAERFPNVWLDLTNVVGSIRMFDEAEAAERTGAILRAGLNTAAGRVMMGTDHPAGMGTIEEIFEELNRFDLEERVREQLLVETAARFFDLYGRPRP
jgi:predicted TIM-barrel fold metal-dependent hydrolase